MNETSCRATVRALAVTAACSMGILGFDASAESVGQLTSVLLDQSASNYRSLAEVVHGSGGTNHAQTLLME
ncbi:hypothetical protein [Kribbella sp. CA-294648]|uniref:hypothetical protein n=1 Tax=Kribbella sp. CA-294648 TaxID=3239948 RepID=UPI003D93373D